MACCHGNNLWQRVKLQPASLPTSPNLINWDRLFLKREHFFLQWESVWIFAKSIKWICWNSEIWNVLTPLPWLPSHTKALQWWINITVPMKVQREPLINNTRNVAVEIQHTFHQILLFIRFRQIRNRFSYLDIKYINTSIAFS